MKIKFFIYFSPVAIFMMIILLNVGISDIVIPLATRAKANTVSGGYRPKINSGINDPVSVLNS